ncbi:MAG TPA: dihydrodipicolinate reductase C-terminal domain-containing protein [Terriglobales bacterium]|nr:dihydrodipicolinate reductase C-terminal domain-containing protein [Terriglobales bacterium]
MNLLVLGKGKTGALVADIARERGHGVACVSSKENVGCAALSASALRGTDVVIDFTTPHAVLGNIEACARAGVNIAVGTTGWYGEIAAVQQLVNRSNIGFVYAANFSVGVNLFFEIVRAAADGLRLGYSGHITEKHHVHKKDAPSGTAVAIRNVIQAAAGAKLDITSVREGEIVGTHILELKSAGDTITLAHESHSRRGFAEGAVRAAEWLKDRKGFYDFKDVFRELS